MKIKTKKQLNLPQLIEWAWENDIKKATYGSENGLSVDFSFDGKAVIGYAFSKSDTFTVEVEEEIMEGTELDGLVELGDGGTGEDFFFSRGLSINDCKDEYTQAFYILNDDLTMTLIWRDGKLVE